MLKGIQFLRNKKGKKTAVLIDLNDTANSGRTSTTQSQCESEGQNPGSL